MDPSKRSPRSAAKNQSNALIAELEQVLLEADRIFAEWSCPSTTECCRFGITGREPYVTSIELLAIKRAIAARGGLRSWRRAGSSDAADGRTRLPLAHNERPCPMLNVEGRCAIYAARPLGCRTFYCERATQGSRVRHREVTELVRRVQVIAARHEPDGDRGRPLTRCL